MTTSEAVDEIDMTMIPKTMKPKKMEYIYVISGNSVVKMKIDDPSDKIVIEKKGGANFIVDEKNNMMYYVIYNRVVMSEGIDGTPARKVLVSGILDLGDIVMDKKEQVLYFTDSVKGTVEKFDIKTGEKSILYDDVKQPSKLSVNAKDK